MLHHFLSHHSFGETNLHLHADNCAGQNKNRYVMAYLMWRVLTGLHREIKISFLLVGHTKFSPDWCFGLFKRLYKRTVITSLNDIAQVAERSAQCNHAQVVGHLDGTSVVPFYDWSTFFDNDRVIKTALKGISQMHHFRFTADRPGCVFVKDSSDGTERRINLLKDKSWRPSAADLPEIITPPGLSLERQWYLYNKIRDFCPDNTKDLVCPLPSQPLN